MSTTEDGAYFLNGATNNSDIQAVAREADWTWAIPTEDEWYKAAYHKNDGVTGNYFTYPTASDTQPSNALVDPDPGNNATFFDSGYTIGAPYYRTEAGAHENSASPYGTFDQGGNVWEWTETIIWGGCCRSRRGGGFNESSYALASSANSGGSPDNESEYLGFRVVAVPEPAALLMVGLGGLLAIRRRR